MRGRNWISGALALVLTFPLAGCSLALPEQPASGQDHFVGFHLVREDAGIPPSQRHTGAAWVSVDHPVSGGEHILEGEQQTDGSYVFPGLEGLNFFFPIHMYPSRDSRTEEDNAVRLSISELESTGPRQSTSDEGTTYSCSGTLYIGPAEEKNGAYWSVGFYPVYQRPDGTVYLTDAAQGVGGRGGVGITQKEEDTDDLPNTKRQSSALEVSVFVEWTERLESVTFQQYSADQTLLREDVLTREEAQALDGSWTVPWEEAMAYTLAVKQTTGGAREYELFPEPYTEDISAPMVVWFLDERGMGVPVTVELKREP